MLSSKHRQNRQHQTQSEGGAISDKTITNPPPSSLSAFKEAIRFEAERECADWYDIEVCNRIF